MPKSLSKGFSYDPSCPSFWRVTSVFDRLEKIRWQAKTQKMTGSMREKLQMWLILALTFSFATPAIPPPNTVMARALVRAQLESLQQHFLKLKMTGALSKMTANFKILAKSLSLRYGKSFLVGAYCFNICCKDQPKNLWFWQFSG